MAQVVNRLTKRQVWAFKTTWTLPLWCFYYYPFATCTFRTAPSRRGDQPGLDQCSLPTDRHNLGIERVKSFVVSGKLISSVALLLMLAVFMACWQQLKSQIWFKASFPTHYYSICHRIWCNCVSPNSAGMMSKTTVFSQRWPQPHYVLQLTDPLSLLRFQK